jgi:hypothetical protein
VAKTEVAIAIPKTAPKRADTMPPNVDAMANVDSFRFYDLPDGLLYLHFAYRDTTRT